MFNMKNHKTAQTPYEKYHREENIGPKADDNAPIHEKMLPHRQGYDQTVTEDQIKGEHEWGESEKKATSEKTQIVEKKLESAKSDYVTHRSDAGDLEVPPINALVEKIRQKRLADDYKVDKKSHWSQTFNEKKQQGSLPKWKKNLSQQSGPVLNNDPERFTGSNTDPTEFHKDTITRLVGNITTADVDNIANGIKTAVSSDHNTAIMAILRLSHDERRELTNIEQSTVVNLKLARNKKILEKC